MQIGGAISCRECRHICAGRRRGPPGTKVLGALGRRRRNYPEPLQAILSAFRGRTLPGVRGRGKSPPESLTRALRGSRGPLPGTRVHDGASAGGLSRHGIGVSGRREARGAGVSTERSAAERASTRRPEESLSAWSQEPARTRGRPAPQRRSALHADTAGAKAPRRWRRAEPGQPSNRGSKTRPRSGAQRSEGSGRNRQRVRKRHRQRM